MPGRSIAVDKLHVYGTPFFIDASLPIESAKPTTSFRRLMIAQDTGSAITGPARADLYFGAGPDAGKVSGRLRHNMRFVMLVPKSLDPMARARRMPLPDARPSETIAKLLPQTDPVQTDPLKDKDSKALASPPEPSMAPAADASKGREVAKPAAPFAQTSTAHAPAAQSVPLPEARPNIQPGRDEPHRPFRSRRGQ